MPTNFITHNTGPLIDTNGTHLQGFILCSYGDLVAAFGTPIVGDEDKSDAEWYLQFQDGTIVTIYNYKDGFNYLGSQGTPVEHISRWHIGGFNKKAVDLVKKELSHKHELVA